MIMGHDNSETFTPTALGGLIVKKFQHNPQYVVYFLMMNGKLQYIGKTKELTKRLQAHFANTCLYDDVFYIECTPRDVDKIERAMISLYQPPLNKVGITTSEDGRKTVRALLFNPNETLATACGFDTETMPNG